MNSPNFYSGDLAAINAGQVAENDSNTRSEDSLRRYLAEQARTRAHLQQTNNYRDVGMRDADVRRELGLGEIGGRRYATDKEAETAAIETAMRERLGLKGYETQGSIADKNIKAAAEAYVLASKDKASEAKALREFQLQQAKLALENQPPFDAAVEQVLQNAKEQPELQAVANNLNANLPALQKKNESWLSFITDAFNTPERIPMEQVELIPEQYRGKISVDATGTARPVRPVQPAPIYTETPATRRMRSEAWNGIMQWQQSGRPESAAKIRAIRERFQNQTGQILQ